MFKIIEPVYAHGEETGTGHHMMWGGDGFFSGWITMALIWAVLILVIAALAVYITKHNKK